MSLSVKFEHFQVFTDTNFIPNYPRLSRLWTSICIQEKEFHLNSTIRPLENTFKCKLVFLARKFIKNSDLATETQIFPLKIPNFRKFLEIKLSILIAYRHSKQSSVNQNHKNKERYWLVTTIETFKIRTISWPLSWKISTCCSGNTCDDFIIIEVRKKQHQ